MAPITAAEEKRQEEKRIKELREFQRGSPANRRCFDCNEMVRSSWVTDMFSCKEEVVTRVRLVRSEQMPQYVCLDFNTFVCTSCSGIQYVRPSSIVACVRLRMGR